MTDLRTHRRLAAARLDGLPRDVRAGFLAAALARAAVSYRADVAIDRDLAELLDATLEMIWEHLAGNERMEPTRIKGLLSQMAAACAGEDEDPRFAHDQEYLAALGGLLLYLLDGSADDARESYVWIMDIWNEVGYDSEALTAYTLENDAKAWLCEAVQKEWSHQQADLETIRSSTGTAEVISKLRSRNG